MNHFTVFQKPISGYIYTKVFAKKCAKSFFSFYMFCGDLSSGKEHGQQPRIKLKTLKVFAQRIATKRRSLLLLVTCYF